MKKITRRLLAIALICCMSISLLTACGSSAPTETAPAADGAAPAEGEKTVLKLGTFHTGPTVEYWENVKFKEFEEKTGIKVEVVTVNQADTVSTYMTWNAADTLPDLTLVSFNFLNSLAAQGMLVDLDSYMAENDPEYDMNRFFPAMIDSYRYQDKLYGLPTDLDQGLMWYNKDLFDAAGVPYPDGTWDWNDLEENAKLLTSGSDASKVYGLTWKLEFGNELTPWLRQNGTDYYSEDGKTCTLNTPEAVEALELVTRMVVDDKSCTIPTANEPFFESGKAAMRLHVGPWFAHYVLPDVDFNWGVAPVPVGPKGGSVLGYGAALGIFESSKNKDAAWEFVKWFMSDEEMLDRAKQFSWFPTVASIFDNEEFMSNDELMSMTREQKEIVRMQAEYAGAPMALASSAENNGIVIEEMSQVFAGEKSLTDAIDAMVKRITPNL